MAAFDSLMGTLRFQSLMRFGPPFLVLFIAIGVGVYLLLNRIDYIQNLDRIPSILIRLVVAAVISYVTSMFLMFLVFMFIPL